MKKSSFITLIIIIAFWSCNYNSEKKQSLVVISEKDVTYINDTLIHEIIDSISIIPLEETPECLLGDVRKIQKNNNEYYIMSEGSNRLSEIYRFSHDGRLLNKIGRLGNARSEYIRIGTFFVYDEKVYVADLSKNRIVIYNVDGKYIDCYEDNENIKFLHDMFAIGNNRALLSYNINFSDDGILYEIIDLKNFKSLHTIPTKYKAEGSFPFTQKEIGIKDESTMLTLPFDNTIYEMNKDNYNLDKRYSLGLFGKIPSFDSNDYEEVLTALEESETNILCGFYVSNNILLFNSTKGSVLWNTDSNKGLFLNNGFDLRKMIHFPFFPLSVCYSDEEGFYSIFTSEEFLSMLPENILENEKSIRLLTEINKIRENKNSIIVKYILKSL